MPSEEKTAGNRQARRIAAAQARAKALEARVKESAKEVSDGGRLLQFPKSGSEESNVVELMDANEVLSRLRPTTFLGSPGEWECLKEVAPGRVCQTLNTRDQTFCYCCGHPRPQKKE